MNMIQLTDDYLKKQLKNADFKQSFINDKLGLDLEYQLEELKTDIAGCRPMEELLGKIDKIEHFVQYA